MVRPLRAGEFGLKPTHFRANLGFQLNDKKAAINIYITNAKRKIPNTDMFEYGISGLGGICEKDKNTNIVIACAHYKYDFGLKPPKYDQLFPSIATHGLVSLNINYVLESLFDFF